MKKTFIALFSALAMVLIGCSQPTGGDIPDWENPPSEIGGGDPTDPAAPEDPVTDPESDPEDPVTDPTDPTDPAAEPEDPVDPEPENLSEYDSLIAALNNSKQKDYTIKASSQVTYTTIDYEELYVEFNVTDFIRILFEKNILNCSLQYEGHKGYRYTSSTSYEIVYGFDMLYMIILQLPEDSIIWDDPCILNEETGEPCDDYKFYIFKKIN